MTDRVPGQGPEVDLEAVNRADAAVLVWGVRPSFRTYIEAVGGTITFEGGAMQLADSFGFLITGQGEDGSVSTRGAVRIRAHDGLLDVTLREPGLIPADGAEALTIASPEPGESLIVGLASERRIGAAETEPFLLHADAVTLFDTYPSGTVLDPVRFFRFRASL